MIVLATLVKDLVQAYWWLIPILLGVAYLKTPSGKGLLGETVVHLCARLFLKRSEYRVVTNVTLPTDDGTTQIDHVIVSPYGVFVIETKNYAGWIFGSAQQKTWTQKFPRSSHKFQNPLHQNYKHVRTLASLLELDPGHLHSLVVFVGASTFKTPMPENVTQAGGYIRFIKSRKSVIFSTGQIEAILQRLQDQRLPPSFKTSRAHAQHVRELVAAKQSATAPLPAPAQPAPEPQMESCPKCGAHLVQRTLTTGARAGTRFVGCSTFPDCRYLRL